MSAAQPAVPVVDLNTTEEQETFVVFLGEPFASLGEDLYFTSDDGVHGVELWKTGGSGTVLVKDICPGVCGSMPGKLNRAGGRILFFAEDGEHGRELWAPGGTEPDRGGRTAPVLRRRRGERHGSLEVGRAATSPGGATARRPARSSSPPPARSSSSPRRTASTASSPGRAPAPGRGSSATWRRARCRRARRASSQCLAAAAARSTSRPTTAPPASSSGAPRCPTLSTSTPSPPCRVTDTRPSAPLLTGQPRTFQVAGSCGIPAEARAVAVNFTAAAPKEVSHAGPTLSGCSGPPSGILPACPLGYEGVRPRNIV